MQEFKPIIIKRQDQKRTNCKFRNSGALKKYIIKLRGHVCQKCKKNCGNMYDKHYIELDHIFPVCLGGDYENELNLQLLCFRCHQQKTNIDKKIIEMMKKLFIIKKGTWEWIIFLPLNEVEELYYQMWRTLEKTKARYEKYEEW